VPDAATSYWLAAEKITQWVDIVLVGIRDATLGMQKRVVQPPGCLTAGDAAALQPQRQELVRAWQASVQLALMVSKEMPNLQIKALQEGIKLLIWAGDRVREVVQHYQEELVAAGGSAAAAGSLPSSGEDSGSELLGRSGQLGAQEPPGLLSAPSWTSGTSRQVSELGFPPQLAGGGAGPTEVDVTGQVGVGGVVGVEGMLGGSKGDADMLHAVAAPADGANMQLGMHCSIAPWRRPVVGSRGLPVRGGGTWWGVYVGASATNDTETPVHIVSCVHPLFLTQS
jgi:hypothetical protein